MIVIGVSDDAIRALGKLDPETTLEPLIRTLKDEDRLVRYRAVRALGDMGDPRAVGPLAAALKDKDETVHEEAAKALGNVDDKRFVEALISIIKNTYVVPELSAALDRLDPDWKNRESAAGIVPKLLLDLESSGPDTKSGIARELGFLGDRRAVEPLITALKTDHWMLQSYIAFALGMLKDARAVEPLIAVFTDEPLKGDAFLNAKRRIAVALGLIGDKRAVEPLLAAMDEESDSVRREIFIALGRLKDPRAFEPLTKELRNKDNRSAQSYAAAALGELGDPRAVEDLLDLKNSGWEVYATAIRALGKIKDSSAVEPLIEDLDYPLEDIQAAAAEALGDIGDKRAIEPLLNALMDKDERLVRKGEIVREKAYIALEKIDPDWRESEAANRAFGNYIFKLQNGSLKERKGAVFALGKLGNKKAIGPLILTINDANWYPVQNDAKRVLHAMTGMDFGDSPNKWQKWWEDNKDKYLSGSK